MHASACRGGPHGLYKPLQMPAPCTACPSRGALFGGAGHKKSLLQLIDGGRKCCLFRPRRRSSARYASLEAEDEDDYDPDDLDDADLDADLAEGNGGGGYGGEKKKVGRCAGLPLGTPFDISIEGTQPVVIQLSSKRARPAQGTHAAVVTELLCAEVAPKTSDDVDMRM